MRVWSLEVMTDKGGGEEKFKTQWYDDDAMDKKKKDESIRPSEKGSTSRTKEWMREAG